MSLKRILGASRYDQLGKLRREEALQPTQTLKLSYLFLDPTLQGLVPLG